MGEIDTKSIKSVQAALSLFENSGLRKKRFSSDEEMGKVRDLEGLVQDLANYKVQLEAKESAYKQSLVKLDHYEEAVDGLSTLLKNTELERHIYINECREAKLHIIELETNMERTINQLSEAEKIKDQLSIVMSELKYTQTELLSAKNELVAIRKAKLEAMTQAEMAETALDMEKANNEELLRHVTELNETILHLKLASIEAHNEKCAVLSEKEDEIQLVNEKVEEAQEEMQYMRQQLEMMKGLEGQLLAKNIFIESLQLELQQAMELQGLAEKVASDAINDMDRLKINLEIQEKENLDQARYIESMKMELNQFRLEIENASEAVHCLKCEVEAKTDELEKTRSEVNDIGQRENEAQVEIALLKAELHKERSKTAAAESAELRAQSEKSSVYVALQQLALEADEAKKETRRLKSEYSAAENGTEYENLKKELECANLKIGELRTRAEQAVSRAEAAEAGKADLEARIQRWKEHKERRKAALVALQEESISRKKYSFKYDDDDAPKTYLPLSKLLKLDSKSGRLS